jgi:hypothetical protein
MKKITMTMHVDKLDEGAILKAVAVWQRRNRDSTGVNVPDGDSDIRGAVIAELCRGYLDSLGEWP